MTHRDRAGDPSGQRAGRREAAGDAGHRQGFPTPAHSPADGSPARPERRLPQVLWAGAFGRPMAFRRGAWLAMSRIAASRAPGRKPWEPVSMGHYQRSLVSTVNQPIRPIKLDETAVSRSPRCCTRRAEGEKEDG